VLEQEPESELALFMLGVGKYKAGLGKPSGGLGIVRLHDEVAKSRANHLMQVMIENRITARGDGSRDAKRLIWRISAAKQFENEMRPGGR
jgi:hypothetical protein